MSNLKKYGDDVGTERETESGPAWKGYQTPVSRLQRVFKKIGLDEAHPSLHQASESEIQAAFARYLHKAERHAELGISADFNPITLPTVAFSEVDNPAQGPNKSRKDVLENRSPLMEPYFHTLSIAEMCVMSEKNIALDQPPLDDEDFWGCRFFFRFVAEAVERGCRVVVMHDEKKTISVMVHVKALRKLKGDSGMALLQVEYNCVPKTDRYMIESTMIREELSKDVLSAIIVGTEHQIHFVAQVLQAHERLLDKTVISKHDEEWYPRHKCIRPSFIVPLSAITSDSEFITLQEFKGDATPGSERAPSDENEPVLHPCAVCDRKSTKLKICSACKSVKYCSRDCQVSDWPSHKKSCKAVEPPKKSKPLPSGASILINPKGTDMGFPFTSLVNFHDPISSITKSKQAKVNHMPAHDEGEIYVIKVQAGPGNCLIYDRQRSFTTMAADPQEHNALMVAIRSVNHKSGPKAYLYAKNEGNQFRVYLEDFPEQYVNW